MDLGSQLRRAAFDQVNRFIALRSGVLDACDLAVGLQFQNGRIPLINPQGGMFKAPRGDLVSAFRTFLRPVCTSVGSAGRGPALRLGAEPA